MNATKNITIDDLVDAVSQALELVAFMIAVPPEEELVPPEESIMVHMDFSGSVNGRAELLAGRDLLKVLAANVLGVDEDNPLAEEKSIDAFKEMLNTALGVMLPNISRDNSDVFDVSIPQANQLESAAEWKNFVSQTDTVVMDIDSRPLAIHLVKSL